MSAGRESHYSDLVHTPLLSMRPAVTECVLNVLKRKPAHVAAVVAPSAYSQFPGTIEQLFTAISKLGFDDVVEAALGAELTSANEAQEFMEKMADGQQLMTTSCCPAWVNLVWKHLPELVDHVSLTPSPMGRLARFVSSA